MQKFSYTVKDKSGKTIKDTVDAISRDALIDKLQKQDFFIVEVSEASASGFTRKKKSLKKPRKFRRKKIKLQDLLTFSRQLATMLEAGVPLIRSIAVIQSQIESRNFFNVINDVQKNVEQGASLSSALAAHPKVFSQFWVSLIEVGEASGTIPKTLDKLAFYLEQQASFRSTIVSGIIYPAILFAVSMGAVAFFALVVGPKFQGIFNSMGVELPWITRTLLDLFDFIKQNLLLLVGGTIAAIVFLKKYIRTASGRLAYEKFLFNSPVIGEIFKLIIVERFSAQMSLLVDSGVPILYALDITERLVDNSTCAIIISDIKEAVKQGELLVAPMERSGFFPSMCVQMITVGEETGELSKMLKHVAVFYQNSVETFMKRFATIIEPFMLVFMGAIIGTIVVAMFLPMFNLSQLGGG
ncbi:MAG: type II secretion system F family protein [Candidatus Omnitrophica bacterium]|nr:type II secretion system F family protein [Candidatus Omnitrophota bacterium]